MTHDALKFYTNDEAIKYVGWLLAAYAQSNIDKGVRLINSLHTDEDRKAAKDHAKELKALYGE
jgi:hypothetical protein